MSARRRHIIWAWVIHTPWVLAVLCILAIIGFFGPRLDGLTLLVMWSNSKFSALQLSRWSISSATSE